MSPFEDALDILVCVIMTALVGWHFAFIPSFIVKLLPIADLAPTWTIAAFIATRGSQVSTNAPQDIGHEKKPRQPIQATVIER